MKVGEARPGVRVRLKASWFHDKQIGVVTRVYGRFADVRWVRTVDGNRLWSRAGGVGGMYTYDVRRLECVS